MAAFEFFEILGSDLSLGTHDATADTIKIFLAAVAYTPNYATHVDHGDVTELAAQNGYTQFGTGAGGKSILDTATQLANGTGTAGAGVWSWKTETAVSWTNGDTTAAWTASFQEVIVANASKGTTAARPILGLWDQSPIALAASAKFTVNFSTSTLLSIDTHNP